MSTILVLGGYGLIGAEVARHLAGHGHHVTIAGRSAREAARVLPDLPFRSCDLMAMRDASDWGAVLAGQDWVVNCAGALQDGPGTDLEQIHHGAMTSLGAAAAAAGLSVVQVSAAGVSVSASTAFFRSKARGDAALLGSGAPCVILRPGLVLATSAYGGTALLRMLAAVPLVQPLALPHTPVQSVWIGDVARAVALAVAGDIAPGETFDLVEDTPQPLARVISAHRRALGFADARWRLVMPDRMLAPVSRIADLLGRLGWLSPLRSTAMAVMRTGVAADPAPWRARFGSLSPLEPTLGRLRLGPEHRLQARALLLMPLVMAVLVLFWALSGLIGLAQIAPAASHLTAVGWPEAMAQTTVVFWALVDLGLAAALLWRPWAQRACLGMIAVSAFYLLGASILTPALWADPLGPLVKVLPGMALALVALPLLERR